MKKYYFILYFTLFTLSCLFSHSKYHIEHYGLSDGLPQRSIMNIIQDKRGFMWFATWDGLCKFDGHNFTSYKSIPENSILINSSRIDKLSEDIHGYIWAQTYSGEILRFDPHKEKFIAQYNLENNPYSTSQITPMSSGKVWLTSENMGVVCIPDTTHNPLYFNVENKTLKSNYIYTVHEDANGNSWILTGSGLVKVSPDNTIRNQFTNTIDNNSAFYSVFETENEIWFGTSEGRIWCFNKNENTFKAFDTGINSNIISIKKIYDNLLIILTSNDGFIICDTGRNTLKKFNKSILKELPTNKMISCFIDQDNNIWIKMDYQGVAKFNILENKLVYYKLNDSKKFEDKFGPRFFIVEDKSKNIWVHPQGGGFFYYDKISGQLLPFHIPSNTPKNETSDILLHDIFIDKQGNLWLSTRRGGVEKIVFDNKMFKSDDFETDPLSSINNEIRAIFEDNDKNIWMGSKDGRIMVYDSQKRLKGYLCADGKISVSGVHLNTMAYTFIQDKDQNIWVGSKGNGIYVLKPHDKSYKIKQYKNNPSDIYSINNDRIYSIHQDVNGQIWIGTYGDGINLFDKKNERFINYNNDLKNYPIKTGNQVRSINSTNTNIYVGTTLGLIVFPLHFNNPDNISYKVYSKTFTSADGLKANDIFDVYVTIDNKVFIATFGGGLSKIIKFDDAGFPAGFKTYDTTSGLYSDIVLSITEDNNNNLWINSEGNLTRFNLNNNVIEQFNDVGRALNNQFFSEAIPLFTSNGEIITGTTRGVITFTPEAISRNKYKPYLALIKFNVLNKDYVLSGKIDEQKRIELNHDENIFNIEFAALDFTDPQKITYAYKLEGVDKEWIYNYNQRIVNYTKLPPGDYIFKVKSTNSDGTWVDNERSLLITIKPAFWQTIWAYLLYAVVFILILFVILRTIFMFYRMRDKILLEQEQTEMKTRFFTDISHEIRTPLTMIVSPVENILSNEKTHADLKPQLQLIMKNTTRMLNMVNQILDFRKIQKQKIRIKEVALGDLVVALCRSFESTAEEQKIQLIVNNEIGEEKIWIDEDGIEKLIFNLVSNSIKHTEAGKKIEVNVFRKDKASVVLQVRDEGKGMTKEVLSKLFTRFASFNTDKSKPSSGIGLSIVKEIVEKHRARINVESDVNKGSTFTIVFQTGLDHFLNDNNVEIIHSNPEHIVPDNNIPDKEEEVNTKMSILVVEDDTDLRTFLKTILLPHYSVIEAGDGKDGYNKAISNSPDFILSDIMMPEMDGIEFLKKVKNNQEISHIPFIFITAKTALDDFLEGTIAGADDYITKPFNIKLLKAKIDNILKQRKRFFEYISENKSDKPHLNESQDCKVTSLDEQFLWNLQKNIIENIDNSELSIDDLVSKTNLSRRVFFNKIKSLTGLAPIEFVRETRIKESAEMLKNTEYKIKEITYMIGFSDSKYFTQCFKEVYGITPTEYRSRYK